MYDDIELVLWILSGLLMAAGIGGVILALVLGERSRPEPSRQAVVQAVLERPVDERALASRKAVYRQGVYVLIGLAVLTAIEYAVAVLLAGSAALLFVLILAKSGLILQYYMHANRLWGEEEAHG